VEDRVKGYWKVAGKCPNMYLLSTNRRGGRIAQRLLAKRGRFPSLFSEELHYCLHLLKFEGAVGYF
jgi:hypothetical protein